MKLRKTTWILLILAFSLAGFAYFYTNQKNVQQESLTQKNQQLFNFSKEDIQKLSIETPKIKLEFEATGNRMNPWQMKQPKITQASEATVSFLVDLLVDGRSEKIIEVPIAQKQEYGLDKPQAIITVTLKNGKTHQILLGNPDFEDKFLYAQIDPMNNPTFQVSLVDKSFQYALDRDLVEWQQKP